MAHDRSAGQLEQLIHDIEQRGYQDGSGDLLTNDRDWHAVIRALKYCPAWPGSAIDEEAPDVPG